MRCSVRSFIALIFVLVGSGCPVGDPRIGGGVEAEGDALLDTGYDTGTDTATDTGTDTGTDTATDTGTDTATDTGTDTATDTGSDACVRPSIDPSHIGDDCEPIMEFAVPPEAGMGFCPSGYHCQVTSGFVATYNCEISCADDCDCPEETGCTQFCDKAGCRYACAWIVE